jgi:protein SCO1/2
VAALQQRFGAHRFNVVSIGFNQPTDTPLAMKAFAAQQHIESPDWDFLSPDPAIIAALTADFGFRALATPSGYDHVLQLSVVDSEGRLAYQLYGDRPSTATLAEVLQRLFDGVPVPEPTALSALLDRVRLLCTVYDPVTGTVRVDYSLALELAGGATFLLSMLLYMLNEWRLRRRAARLTRRKASARTPAQAGAD